MLWIAVEEAGTVCDGDYSIFFWTVDRLKAKWTFIMSHWHAGDLINVYCHISGVNDV